MSKVLTAPLAIIKSRGTAIGLMRSIRVSENIQRAEIRGLGSLTPKELPATSWSGTVQCDFYHIDLARSGVRNAINRSMNTVQEFIDTLILDEEGVDLEIYKKEISGRNQNGVVESGEGLIASIKGLFIDTDGFDVAEAQVSGRNQSFKYIYPLVRVQ